MDTGLTLTADMMLVLVILTATIGLFVSELVRVDIAAILVMVVIGLTGLVPATDLFDGKHVPIVQCVNGFGHFLALLR